MITFPALHYNFTITATLLAKPCLLIGKAVPIKWQECANKVAKNQFFIIRFLLFHFYYNDSVCSFHSIFRAVFLNFHFHYIFNGNCIVGRFQRFVLSSPNDK